MNWKLNWANWIWTLKTFLLHHNCDFILSTPASSHMGGLWERQIGTVKRILVGLLVNLENRSSMSSLWTFFYEVMAIVNSFPLMVDNHSNASDIVPLSPSQMLTIKTRSALPPPGDFLKEDAYARKRWRQVQYMPEQFWKRWWVYFRPSRLAKNWMQNQYNLKEGDVII